MIAWPNNLVDSISRRRAVVVIGSGVSANAQSASGERPPTWADFLRKAYTNLGRRVRHISEALGQNDMLAACEFLKSEYGADWTNCLNNSFVSPGYKSAEIHKAIFDIDVRTIISLNFDQIYEDYARSVSENTVFVKSYYDSDVRQTLSGPDRYILKPHGSIDTPSRLLFTLESYAKARVKNAPFYEMINALLHTNTFILLGCGLNDPDVRLIFEDYRFKFDEAPHYMTMSGPVPPAVRNMICDTRGIHILSYSKREHHRELTLSLIELAHQVSAKREQIADSRNW